MNKNPPAPIQSAEFSDTYGTGIKPWSQRIPANSDLSAIEGAMQSEINELRAVVAAAPKQASSEEFTDAMWHAWNGIDNSFIREEMESIYFAVRAVAPRPKQEQAKPTDLQALTDAARYRAMRKDWVRPDAMGRFVPRFGDQLPDGSVMWRAARTEIEFDLSVDRAFHLGATPAQEG